jgi:hypothetical protein
MRILDNAEKQPNRLLRLAGVISLGFIGLSISAVFLLIGWVLLTDSNSKNNSLNNVAGVQVQPEAREKDVQELSAALAANYQNKLIAFVQRNYEIDPDHFIAHSGGPIPSDGRWSHESVSEWPDKPAICSESDVICEGVKYETSSAPVICYWVVAILPSDTGQRVYENDAARFYFRKTTNNGFQ